MFRKARFIVEETCLLHGISTEELLLGTRTHTLATTRAAIARRLLLETNLSGREISGFIGRKSPVKMRDYVKQLELSTPLITIKEDISPDLKEK